MCSRDGETPLHVARCVRRGKQRKSAGDSGNSMEGHTNTVQKLLGMGCVLVENHYGMTPRDIAGRFFLRLPLFSHAGTQLHTIIRTCFLSSIFRRCQEHTQANGLFKKTL
eukprot:608847-Hanusia_phi.AAC.3